LAWSDWRLLIAVAVLQVVLASALRVVPLTSLPSAVALLRRFARLWTPYQEARVIWAIRAAGVRLGGLSTCLVRALVAALVLDSTSRPVSVSIGVRRTADGTLESHAWATRGSSVVMGAPHDGYVPFLQWKRLPI
jgi:hypothetical protein